MSLKKLEVHHATKRIHGNTVLQDISCTFLSGKIYGLKGINGSGKTMLMRLLCGLIRPSEGEIFYDEKKLGTDFRFPPGVGILLENPSFLDSCTGLQNLKMIADINQKITEKEIRNTLFRVGLDPDDQRKYKKYSLGMKQRLGIAAAVMEKPDLLILDEPFNALDTSGIEMVSHLLEEEKKNGALVIFSCHDNEILKMHSDQIFVCYDQPEAGLTGNAQRREQLMNRSFVYTENMTVGYDGKALIRNIRLSLEKGQILTLIGPNGAGKSTILKSIIRQLKLVDGAVFLDQKSMEKMSDKEISRKLAVVMTGRMQPELMTCEDIVGTGRYPYTGVLGILSAEDHEKVRSAMELVHAWDLKDRDFSAVSDGQRQRILLARAICQEPEVIVLDEPTSFLDIRHKLELLSILKEMVRKQHVAVLMSLHELDLAQKVSDLVICVHGDRIERCGVPEEIFTDEYIRQLYGVTAGSYNASFGCLEMEPARGKPEVFVIAGGGSGIPVFRQLQRQGIPFATGVLQENDVDYQVAKALAAKVVTERPFEEISEEHYQEAVELMRSCKKVILAVSGFGSMNRRNEELKKEAEKLGILEK